MLDVTLTTNETFFKKCGDQWVSYLNEILMQVALQAEGELAKEAPKDTGTLRRSFNVKDDGILSKSILTNTDYWMYVVYGTAPHTIRPKKGNKMLHWKNKNGEGYAKKVEHPGTAPNNFPQRAVNKIQSRGDIEKITKKVLIKHGVLE